MLKVTISRPSNKNLLEDENHIQDAAKFAQDYVDHGKQQAFINLLTDQCTSLVESGTHAAFIAGGTALLEPPFTPIGFEILTVEGLVISKAVAKASEALCQDGSTVAVNFLEGEFQKLDGLVNNIAGNVASPNGQATSDFQSMLASAANGDPGSAIKFATSLNQDFSLSNFVQTPAGNYLLSENGANELFDPNFHPIQLFSNNSDGSSDLVAYGSQGGQADSHYNEANLSGGKSYVDIERGNDTSALVTFDSSGNPTIVNYSGPNQTGNIISNGSGNGGSSGVSGGQSGSGSGGQSSSGVTTFHYQGNEFNTTTDAQTGLISQGMYDGSLSANIVIDDLPSNYTGRISESQNGSPYFVYNPNGEASNLYINGSSTNIESQSYIDLTNGAVTDWDLLGDSKTSVSTNLHIESASGFGPYSGDFASETSSSSSSYLKTGANHTSGTWTST